MDNRYNRAGLYIIDTETGLWYVAEEFDKDGTNARPLPAEKDSEIVNDNGDSHQ